MNWPALMSAAPIGVDIGSRCIKAVQCSGQRITAAVSIPRTGANGTLERSEIGLLSETLLSSPFKGRSVVLAAPADKLLSGIMELPPRSSGAPIEKLAHVELARRHGVDIGSVEMACWELPSPARAANRAYVMSVAYPQKEADGLLDMIEAEGLNVEALDVHAQAVSRACVPLLENTSGTGAILDMGWTSSKLVLLYRSTVVYERNLARCGIGAIAQSLASSRDTDQTIAERFLIEDGLALEGTLNSSSTRDCGDPLAVHMESMIGEMRIPLSYLSSQYPDAQASRLLMIGGGAGIKGLGAYIASKLELDLQIVSPGCLGGTGPWGPQAAFPGCDRGTAFPGCEAGPQAGKPVLRNLCGPSLICAVGLAMYDQKVNR